MDKQVFQELTSLKPHTHYDITVEAKPTNGTYWGDTAQIWEKTRESGERHKYFGYNILILPSTFYRPADTKDVL